MATSQYTYHPYHTIGAATVLLWDPGAGGEEVGGAWRPLGKVADAAVVISTEQAGKDLTIKGLTQPIARRNRAKRYSITFRLLEDANPLTLDLLGGEGAALGSHGSELITTTEVLRLYGTDWRELAHPYGLAAEPPSGVSGAQASAGGSGGTIPPGTYYYWVVPCLEAGGDIFEGPAAPAGSETVGSGEQVTVSFALPTDWTPDGYRVYYNSSDTLSGAQLAGSGSGSPLVLSEHVGTLSYSAAAGPLVIVRSFDGGTLFTEGSDYLLDVEKGLVKRIQDGAIADGQQVVAIYAYWRPASVLTPLGDAVDLERYRQVRLLQLAPDDPDPALWRETGVEFTFFRVNVALGDSRWPFSENDFSEGASVTWDCLFDGEQAKVGTARSTYGVLAEYE
jgi:hypothetical protein